MIPYQAASIQAEERMMAKQHNTTQHNTTQHDIAFLGKVLWLASLLALFLSVLIPGDLLATPVHSLEDKPWSLMSEDERALFIQDLESFSLLNAQTQERMNSPQASVGNYFLESQVWSGSSWAENIIVNGGDNILYQLATQRGFVDASSTVTIEDIIGLPTNGGSIGPIGNENVVCAQGSTYSGSLSTGGITMQSPLGGYCIIEYVRTADSTGIPIGQTSTIINTVTLSNGQTDTASVSINGPAAAPIPATVWLFGAGMIGLLGFRRKSTI